MGPFVRWLWPSGDVEVAGAVCSVLPQRDGSMGFASCNLWLKILDHNCEIIQHGIRDAIIRMSFSGV